MATEQIHQWALQKYQAIKNRPRLYDALTNSDGTGTRIEKARIQLER